jgi:hypothetical protein
MIKDVIIRTGAESIMAAEAFEKYADRERYLFEDEEKA